MVFVQEGDQTLDYRLSVKDLERKIVLLREKVVVVMKTMRRIYRTSLTFYCQELGDLSDNKLLIFAIFNPLNQTSR